MQIETLGADALDEVLDVLTDAFADYPVMRYTLGREPDYPRRLRSLIGLFAGRRFACLDPVYGLRQADGKLLSVAVTTSPDPQPMPAPFQAHREQVWLALGAATRARYEAFADACNGHEIDARHHYLNMLGVRREQQGRGLAGRLLDHVHAQAQADDRSLGVALSTELAANLSLYQRFGYRITGHARVSDELETWALLRESREHSERRACIDSPVDTSVLAPTAR